MTEQPEDNGPTIRDNRRIDPDTYELRDPAAPAADAAGVPVDEEPEAPVEGTDREAELARDLADRTADLQRLQAEYVNYKRRVDRDRAVARQSGVEAVLTDLLRILDDLANARKHEELDGGFKIVAAEIEELAAKYGLAAFGEQGDPFDPNLHDAMMHQTSPEVTVPTCMDIFESGYMLGEKVFRPARVLVVGPDPSAAAAGSES